MLAAGSTHGAHARCDRLCLPGILCVHGAGVCDAGPAFLGVSSRQVLGKLHVDVRAPARIMDLEPKHFHRGTIMFEIIKQPLYHWQDAPADGFLRMNFFHSAAGLDGNSLEDTNMTTPSQLPASQYFIFRSLHVAVAVEGKLADIQNLILFKSARFELVLGSVIYASYAPIGYFPYMAEDIKPLENLEQFSGIEPVSPVPYNFLDKKLVLVSNQNFLVTLRWKKLVKAPAIKRIGVILDGNLYRPVQ